MENDAGHKAAQQNAHAEQLKVEPAGTHLALAQSLRAMGEAQQDGHEGWAVVSRRAEGFVRQMGLSVTRLVFQPDLRLRHATLDEDLQVLAASVGDDASVSVSCMGIDGHTVHRFPLDELVPAGPVNDAIRLAVVEMMRTLVEDTIGKAVAEGALPGLATFDQFHLFNRARTLTPTELLDECYQLAVSADQADGGPGETAGKVLMSRDQLGDAMCAAVLQSLSVQAQLAEAEEWPFHAKYAAGGVVGEQLAVEPGSESVDHLQAHPSYIMGRDGSCEPDEGR